MRVDFHTHSILSDGELIPAELVRRAMACGHDAIAITDHVDMSNVEHVVKTVVKAAELSEDYIKVIPGVEITHVPPSKIEKVAKMARKYGAKWIVVHGETVAEPVIKGTNRAAVLCQEVDLLAHPGFISDKEMEIAVDNSKYIEITGRKGHNITNGYVVSMAREFGAKMLIDSDAHSPDDLMNYDRALAVALGAGLNDKEAKLALETYPADILNKLL